jgi:RNA polymerase sigma factor (sigma-70 family)
MREKHMKKNVIEGAGQFVSPEERAHLIRLCATLTGDREAAEDLAQETLLEAWRHRHALRDQARYTYWLSGIARNVCLRWLRRRGRDTAHLLRPSGAQPAQNIQLAELEDSLADDLDIEVDLERRELVELLDRALALLPVETRIALVEHYVEESSLAEVAAQLGTNAHAVAVRLQRGKLALRRVLTTTMHHELVAYDLPSASDTWEETPLWCYFCGQRRLLGKRRSGEGELLLKCPACSPGPEAALSTNRIPLLKGVKGYKPLHSRLRVWCDNYYRTGLSKGSIACQSCGHMHPIVISSFEDLPHWARTGDGPPQCVWRNDERVVATLCSSCKMSSRISLESLALSLPEGREFLHSFPRIRTLPKQQVEVDGRGALVTRFESVTGTATLTVVSAYNTYEVLRIYRGGW